jgi:hypothetical protein
MRGSLESSLRDGTPPYWGNARFIMSLAKRRTAEHETGATIMIVIVTAMSFAACGSVWSCIDVIACKNEMLSPTSAATITAGSDTLRHTNIPRVANWIKVSNGTGFLSLIGQYEAMN